MTYWCETLLLWIVCRIIIVIVIWIRLIIVLIGINFWLNWNHRRIIGLMGYCRLMIYYNDWFVDILFPDSFDNFIQMQITSWIRGIIQILNDFFKRGKLLCFSRRNFIGFVCFQKRIWGISRQIYLFKGLLRLSPFRQNFWRSYSVSILHVLCDKYVKIHKNKKK